MEDEIKALGAAYELATLHSDRVLMAAIEALAGKLAMAPTKRRVMDKLYENCVATKSAAE